MTETPSPAPETTTTTTDPTATPTATTTAEPSPSPTEPTATATTSPEPSPSPSPTTVPTSCGESAASPCYVTFDSSTVPPAPLPDPLYIGMALVMLLLSALLAAQLRRPR